MFVLVKYEPTTAEPSAVRLACHGIDGGNAMLAFTSPFDAWIEASYSSTAGAPFRVINARQFDPREMVRDHAGKLNLCIHIGWTARDGKLMTKKNGKPISYSLLQTVDVAATSDDAITLVLDTAIRDRIDLLYEKSGLFAHAKAVEESMSWGDHQLDQEVAMALTQIPGTFHGEAVDVGQLAVYDLEGKQWHFVTLADMPDEND